VLAAERPTKPPAGTAARRDGVRDVHWTLGILFGDKSATSKIFQIHTISNCKCPAKDKPATSK